MIKKVLFILIGLIQFTTYAKELPEIPNPPKLVNDFANVLSIEQKNALETKLVHYFDSTSTQIVIVIETSIEGEDVFDYSHRLAQAWGIGEKGKNNGLLIYVAINDRKIRIQTGYGMEGAIPDAYAKRIIENNVKPNFKKQNYFQGLDEAVDIIIKAVAGEYVYDRAGKKGSKFPGWLIVVIIILVIIAITKGGRGGGGRGFMSGPMWYGTLGGGGFSGGSSWGGSRSSGGGFGGFGGGSFGGGGAGGSW